MSGLISFRVKPVYETKLFSFFSFSFSNPEAEPGPRTGFGYKRRNQIIDISSEEAEGAGEGR